MCDRKCCVRLNTVCILLLLLFLASGCAAPRSQEPAGTAEQPHVEPIIAAADCLITRVANKLRQ